MTQPQVQFDIKKQAPIEGRATIKLVHFRRDGNVVMMNIGDIEGCVFEPVSLWHRIRAVFSPPPRVLVEFDPEVRA